jgi:hypothetical protein
MKKHRKLGYGRMKQKDTAVVQKYSKLEQTNSFV